MTTYRTGTRIERKENPCHTGRIDAVSGMPGVEPEGYRVTWDCGWREDVAAGEVQPEGTFEAATAGPLGWTRWAELTQ